MSIPTSKSKTQLAYTRSTKTVNKPKTKNNNQTQQNDLIKTKQPSRNSTGNIYESIMGQIDTTQQDYIKSLIVKNEKQTLKSQKESQKQLAKGLKQPHQQKKTTVSIIKAGKQTTISQKGSMTNLHQRTKSQADLSLKQSQVVIETQKIIKIEPEKPNNEIRCVSEEAQDSVTSSQVKPVIPQKDTNKKQQFSTTFPQSQKQQKPNVSTNPIIEALNNTSASFAKKLQAFQLQYPSEERQQRSTHKKVGSRLGNQYFSCQTSPKNGGKHIYTQQVIVTTKPQQVYYCSANKNDRHQSTKISPISAGKNSTAKINPKRLNQNDQNMPTSFLSCLDEYLQALSVNTNEGQQNNRPSNGSYNMKRNSSNKMREFPIAKGLTSHFVFDKEDQEEETIVLQSVNYHNALHNKIGQPKHLSIAQQQKLIKSLQKEKKKVSQLKAIVDLFNQQLSKYKKKQKKLKQNQFHMIEQLKFLNKQLTQEKKQRRKLQQVVKQFESKIRGISKDKDKKRRGSMEEQQRPERKTIYGVSMANSIHYGQPVGNFYYQPEMIEKETSNKLQRPSKKGSKNRFSSVINSMTQDYSRNVLNSDEQYDNYYPEKRAPVQDNGFSKNRTQKISKIISTFELENQPINEDEMIYRSSQMRNSTKNINPPNSCKNSYMNNSLPGSRQTKSRPMTPKLIQQLFKGSKKSNNNQSQQQQLQYFNQRIQNNNFESESEEQFSPEYMRQQQYNNYERNINESQQQQDSSFNPTVNSDESDQYQERNDRDYQQMQPNDMVIRMR